MLEKKELAQLKAFAAEIRMGILEQLRAKGVGHAGGSMSIADVLAVLYGKEMSYKVDDPNWADRDRVVCSKGHAGPALYATLALKGFFPYEQLLTLNQPKTMLPSHCDHSKTPGIDMTTGSLGQGVSLAVGSALACKLQGRSNRVFLIVGDGECNEGQVWEACQVANHQKLDHLIVLVDWNKLQLDGTLEEICDPVDLQEKFISFGFACETVPGHDVKAIWEAIERAKAVPGKPHCIMLDTIKGLGIPLAERADFNHYMTFGPEEGERSVEEIERRLANGTYPGGDIKC